MSPLTLDKATTAFVVIDVQEKLLAVMHEKAQARMLKNGVALVKGMAELGVPTLVTEQYPKGLGPTVPQLAEALDDSVKPIEKLEFDCACADGFMDRVRELGAKTVVLSGMEAHICVLQTAAGLMREGLDVWVAEDAIASRADLNWRSAVETLRHAGAVVLPTESILFLLLGKSGTPEFKTISKLIK